MRTRTIKHRISSNLQHRGRSARAASSIPYLLGTYTRYDKRAVEPSRGIVLVRSSTIVMIGFAVLFGLLAVFIAQAWLNSQAEMRARNLDSQKKPIATQTVVAAAKPLRFGAELGAMSLREVAWPEGAVPVGAFNKIADLTASRR